MLVEIIGWIGSICVLLAYVLVSTSKISGHSKIYQLLNLLGALGIIINTWFHRAFPSTTLNVIWLGIAVYGLVNAKK